jgi:hypothetical protein
MKSTLPNIVGKPLLLFLCTLLFTQSYSQHLTFGNEKLKIEAGLNFGPTFFLGDLGGNRGKGTTFVKDVNLELTKMMKGAFITVYPTHWLGLRAAAQITYISGEDDIINTKGVDELWRKQRNLDFKSNMWEVYGAVEIYPTMLLRKYDDYEPRLKPYGFIGVGAFHFNPKGSLTDANGDKIWYELHPLRTEGQGFAEYPDKKPYSLTQLNIPMGVGIKYALSEKINIGTELLYRKTFTDYIDDVSTSVIDPNYFDLYLSPANATIARKIHDKTIGIISPGLNRYPPGTQRGNPKNMDAYFSVVAKVGINLGTSNSEDKRLARQTRCPHFY